MDRMLRFLRWVQHLWHKELPDDRWWENGYPVEYNVRVYHNLGAIQLFMMKEMCKREFDLDVDINLQIWGEGPGKQLDGLQSVIGFGNG